MDRYQVLFTKAAGGIHKVGGFSDPGAVAVRLAAVLHPAGVAGPAAHLRPLTRLPSDKLAQVLEGVGAAIDARGGSFTMPSATVAVTAARTSTTDPAR